ncbi:MAG: hypothetical protein WCJ30_08620 [Deltaproteobacteria bacterium]
MDMIRESRARTIDGLDRPLPDATALALTDPGCELRGIVARHLAVLTNGSLHAMDGGETIDGHPYFYHCGLAALPIPPEVRVLQTALDLRCRPEVAPRSAITAHASVHLRVDEHAERLVDPDRERSGVPLPRQERPERADPYPTEDPD